MKIRLTLLILATAFCLFGQQGNPFDIKNREGVVPAGELKPLKVDKDNPFNIVVTDIDPVLRSSQQKLSKRNVLLPRNGETSLDFVFWLIIGILLLLAYVIGTNLRQLNRLSRCFLNSNILKLTSRERSQTYNTANLVLQVLMSMNLSLYIFLYLRHFALSKMVFNGYAYLYILGLVSLMIFLKHGLLYIIGTFFPFNKEVRLYGFTIFVFNIMMGLGLIPINLIAAFAPSGMAKTVLLLGLAMIVGLFVYRALRGLFVAGRYLVVNFFHFFIYLCTVEIAPVLIFVKIFILNTGLL